MIYKLYAVRDIKVGFMAPVAQQNDSVAIRSFDTAVRQSREDLGVHPEDFDLWLVGSFDTDTGLVHSQQPQQIYSGVDVRKE